MFQKRYCLFYTKIKYLDESANMQGYFLPASQERHNEEKHECRQREQAKTVAGKENFATVFADNLTSFIHGLSTKAKICLTYFKISQTYFELCALYFFFAPRGGENYPEKDRQIMIAEILLKSAGSYTVKNKCRQEDVAGTCLVHSAAAFMLNGVFSCCCSNRAHARCGT